MGKSIEQRRADGQAGHEKMHGDLVDFHTREAAKYHAKADELEAAGKVKAAARSRKVAERSDQKAAEHQAKLAEGYTGYQTKMADDLAELEAEKGAPASRAERRGAFRNR